MAAAAADDADDDDADDLTTDWNGHEDIGTCR